VTEPRLDPTIHAPHRLRICSMLSVVRDADFATLRDELGVSDSVLSKQLRTLEEAGYVKVRKTSTGGRSRTWASLTAAGRRAFTAHVAELRRIVDGADVGPR
jgi:DNA-binding MarR family transcriptional regulator